MTTTTKKKKRRTTDSFLRSLPRFCAFIEKRFQSFASRRFLSMIRNEREWEKRKVWTKKNAAGLQREHFLCLITQTRERERSDWRGRGKMGKRRRPSNDQVGMAVRNINYSPVLSFSSVVIWKLDRLVWCWCDLFSSLDGILMMNRSLVQKKRTFYLFMSKYKLVFSAQRARVQWKKSEVREERRNCSKRKRRMAHCFPLKTKVFLADHRHPHPSSIIQASNHSRWWWWWWC